MRKLGLIAAFFIFVSQGGASMAKEGLITVASHHPVAETRSRLVAEIAKRDLTLFPAIDHQAAAQERGMGCRMAILTG